VHASAYLVTSAAQRLKAKPKRPGGFRNRTYPRLPLSLLGPSVAPLECDVLQLATALNLQHDRVSWSRRLRQRPKLLNRFDCVLVGLVNDVPGAQVRCVNVQAGRPRNFDDSRRIPRTGEGAVESIIQVDHENPEAIDHVSRIDEIRQVASSIAGPYPLTMI
jgi:hypothetical protein